MDPERTFGHCVISRIDVERAALLIEQRVDAQALGLSDLQVGGFAWAQLSDEQMAAIAREVDRRLAAASPRLDRDDVLASVLDDWVVRLMRPREQPGG